MSNNDFFETMKWDTERVRRQTAETQRKPKRPKKQKISRTRYFICCALVSLVLAVVGWLLASDMCSLNKDYTEVTIEVTEDDSVRDVAKKLKQAKLIRYKGFFMLTSGFFHAKSTIDPGTYELNSDMDYRCLISSLHDYEKEELEAAGLVKVTLPEGLNVSQVIDLLVKNGVASKEELEDAAANYEFQDYNFLDNSMLGDINRMEGYLLPDTYEFDTNKSAVFAFDTMLTNFVNQVVVGSMQTTIENSDYSLKEIITIASLVEKETDGTDRSKIASVIYNRLEHEGETNHFLQIDAALQYVLGREVTEEDYKTLDSDYNLYQHQGLPPTPIASPGIESIKAAVYPDDTDYYFYVLGNDGHHIYSRTLAEHNAAMNG